ncbi:unnamed protein product, partial [Rotaria sp. Silwood1]
SSDSEDNDLGNRVEVLKSVSNKTSAPSTRNLILIGQ